MLDDETKSFMGHRLNAPEGCVPFYRSRKKSKRIQLFGENARESSRFAVCAPLRSHTTRPPAVCIPPSPAGIQPAFHGHGSPCGAHSSRRVLLEATSVPEE